MAANFRDIGPTFQQIEPFARLCELLPSDTCYLVGGALRDALLGHPVVDIDIASPDDPTALAKSFAQLLNVPWFWLDEERRQSRVLVEDKYPITFDFAPFRAPELHGDLLARDFTINSLAYPLSRKPVFENSRIHDPLGGLDDLLLSTLRMSSPQAFTSDPLRILKGVRHAVKLGFVLEEETSLAMVKHAWRLEHVAIERVRQEVWAILGHESAAHGLQMLSATGAGAQLWGNGFDGHLSEIIAVVEQCRREWHCMAQAAPEIEAWLAEDAEQGFTREALLLFQLTFSRVLPGLPEEVAEEWRLSRRSQARIKSVGCVDEILLDEMTQVAESPRAFSLWLQKKGLDPKDFLLVVAVLVANSDSYDQRFVLSRLKLVDESFATKPVDLISGNCLSEEFGLSPGPAVGEALQAVRDAEIAGLVDGREQARDFLHEYCQNKD